MRVHDSQAYRKMGVTRERISHILKLREILLSFQTGFNLGFCMLISGILERAVLSITAGDTSPYMTEGPLLVHSTEESSLVDCTERLSVTQSTQGLCFPEGSSLVDSITRTTERGQSDSDLNNDRTVPQKEDRRKNDGCGDKESDSPQKTMNEETVDKGMPRIRAEADQGAGRDQRSLQKNFSMLVYGLGNFASCVIARYQLALLLALKQHWKVNCDVESEQLASFSNANPVDWC